MTDQQNGHTFWVAPRPSDMAVYHLDKHCRRLKEDPKERNHRYVEWHDLEPCDWCNPDKNSPFEDS